MAKQSSRITYRTALTGILFLAFALRVWGIGFGLPHLYHADEPIVVNHALAYSTWDFNPHFFKIPPLVSYLLFFCYGVFFLVGHLVGWFQSVQDFEYLFYGSPTVFYLIARVIFGAAAGTASVYLLNELGRRFFDPKKGLLAALLLAVVFLHVRDSHYVYADIPLLFVLLAGFFPILALVKNPLLWRHHIAAGIAIGAATATKYNGVVLVVPYLAVCLFHKNFRSIFNRIYMAAFFAVGTYSLLNPYSWIDFPFFLQEIKRQAASQGGVPWFHHLRYSLWEGAGPILLGVTILALVRCLKTKNALEGVISLWILAYYLVLILGAQHYDRYVLPLIPFMCLLAGSLLADFWKKQRLRFLAAALTVLIVVPNLIQSILFDRIMSQSDIRTVAKEWIEHNIPAGSAIAMDWEFYMPRLSFSDEQLQEKKNQLSSAFSKTQERKLNYLLTHSVSANYRLHFLSRGDSGSHSRFLFAQPLVPYSLEDLKRTGIEYVLTGRFSQYDDPRVAQFKNELQASAQLIAEFNPYHSSYKGMIPMDAQPLTGGPVMFSDLWNRRANGHLIQIYQLKPET